MLNGSAGPLVGCLLGLGSSMSHATVRMFTKSTGLLGGERGTWIHGEAHGGQFCLFESFLRSLLDVVVLYLNLIRVSE